MGKLKFYLPLNSSCNKTFAVRSTTFFCFLLFYLCYIIKSSACLLLSLNLISSFNISFDQDIAPRYAGFLHGMSLAVYIYLPFSLRNVIELLLYDHAGIANSLGTLAAIISTIGTGYFVQWLGSFQAFLTVTACLYFVTTIFWNLYATGERVF